MAILTPIANKISAFDSRMEKEFSFVYSGGDQVVKNKLTIINNKTGNIVYQKTISTYLYKQTLPSNILENGVQYSYYFNVFDEKGNQSNNSNIVIFYCYTTPILTFTNIVENQTINASNFTFNLEYRQNEYEKIKYAIFYLYKKDGTLIKQSQKIYNSEIPPTTISYDFDGFFDKTNYYVVVNLYTSEDTIVSNSVDFYVSYYASNIYSILSLSNNCKEGRIEISNNMVLIDGISTPSNPTYIDNTKIDLSGDGDNVVWNDGYVINGDFTLSADIYKLNVGEIIYMNTKDMDIELNNISVNIEQDYPYGETDKKYFASLKCFNGEDIEYQIYSNYISSLDHVFLWIRRINNIFQIKLEELE